MATTRIMPLHVGKGRTESRAISDIIDYVANPQKTDNGRLIAGFACDSRTVDAEFLLAKRQYIVATGRVRGTDDVIAYHVRQSFRPGEITPEEANRLGVEFARRFTKGNHAFVVCTHIDKSHIHNHIIWSSVSLEYDRKFRNFWGSTKAVRRLSDTICIENGLSIVENPKPHGKSYNKWLGDQAKEKKVAQTKINQCKKRMAKQKEELKRIVKESGYATVKSFMDNYNKTYVLIMEYQKEMEDWKQQTEQKVQNSYSIEGKQRQSIREKLQRKVQVVQEREAQKKLVQRKDRRAR